MKIINNLSNHTFDSIRQGDVFMFQGCPYMKTDDVYDNDNNHFNAIDLAVGEGVYFNENDTIRIVKATLTLE